MCFKSVSKVPLFVLSAFTGKLPLVSPPVVLFCKKSVYTEVFLLLWRIVGAIIQNTQLMTSAVIKCLSFWYLFGEDAEWLTERALLLPRFTSCLSFYSILNELNDYAGQREVVAEEMGHKVYGELLRYSQDLKAERKHVSTVGFCHLAGAMSFTARLTCI